MRKRRVWLCAGLLLLAVCVAIPIRQRHHSQELAHAAAMATMAARSPAAPPPKRDFKRTLSSAQVWDKIATLDLLDKEEERGFLMEILGIAENHLVSCNYESAELVADAILTVAPRWRRAKELAEDVGRASVSVEYARFLALRRVRNEGERRKVEGVPPFDPELEGMQEHLSRKSWRVLLLWAAHPCGTPPPLPWCFFQTTQEREDDEVLAIQHKLESCRIDLDFTDSSLYDIVDYVEEFAKINIVIAAEVRKEGIPDRKISFEVKDRLLKDTLRDLLDRYGLDWTYENRVLLITTPLLAAGGVVLRTYDIHDHVESGKWKAEEIQAKLREQIAPQSWVEREGEVSMVLDRPDRLLIAHVPRVQAEVSQYLEILRKQK